MKLALHWLKRKDGSLIARRKKGKKEDIYTLTTVPLYLGVARTNYNGTITGYRYSLAKNGVRVYDLDVGVNFQPMFTPPLTEAELKENKEKQSRAKAAMFEVANQVVNNGEVAYQAILSTLKNKDKYNTKEQFIYSVKEVMKLDRLPSVSGPHRKFFIKCAEEGLSPMAVPINRLEAAGIYKRDLSPAYLDSLWIELFPIWRTKMTKDARLAAKKYSPVIVAETKDKSPENHAEPESEQTVERYTGEAPEERSAEGLVKLHQVVMTHPKPPFKPENAKFSSLRKWAEKVRDWFQIRGYFPTVEYLVYYLQYFFDPSWDRCRKAARRIKLIYQDEWDKHAANIDSQIKVALSKPKEEEVKDKKPKGKTGKDAWGFRLGTRAASVNAVFLKKPKSRPRMSKEKIAKLAKADGDIGSHLSSLLKKKLIRRLPDGKYRLKRQ